MGARLKLTLAIWSRMGFHRVFQTASRKQIGNLQNLSKLEKQAHHPNAKRNCLNPFLDQYIQCVIEVESAPNCRRQFGSLRRTPSSDGGVLLLRPLEAQMAIIKRLSQILVDHRHPSYVNHSYEDLMRQRVFQIACGYEDANDCDFLRHDPAFKAA